MDDEPEKETRKETPAEDAELNAEDFFADIVGHLAETLEETVGLEDSASFVAAVGGRLGEDISRMYAEARRTPGDEDRAAAIGHDAGDAVLRELAQRFAAATRSGDCVARLGGDEFAFWFDGMTEAEVGPIVGRLEEAARRPVEWRHPASGDDVRLRVDASFGRASAPADGRTFAALKTASDARMYASKRRKRNKVAL